MIHGKRQYFAPAFLSQTDYAYFFTSSTAGAWKSVIWYDSFPIVCVHKFILLSSSAVIEDIRCYCALQKFGLASLAFFYCDFREDQKKDIPAASSSRLVPITDEFSNDIGAPAEGAATREIA